MRINYRNLTIDALQERAGMTETQAEAYFNRVYNKARAEVKGASKGLNVTKEIYSSLFYQTKNVFQIDNSGNKVELNQMFSKSKNIGNDLRLARMENFFDKYGESATVQEAFRDYSSGRITRKEFNERIKTYKKYNTRYLKAGS